MNIQATINYRPLLTLLALAALTMLSACPADQSRPAEHAAAEPEFMVSISVIESRESPSFVELTGTVTGRHSVPLSTRLMSEITQLTVEAGQAVSKGDVLVVLDDSDILAMRSEAAAYRAEAQAALGEVDAVRSQASAGVLQSEAALAKARAAQTDADLDLSRMQQLFAESIISRSELEKFQLSADLARESVAQASAAIDQAQAAVAQADSRIPQVEAKKQQASARDLQAAALQEYAVLQAPFDGLVSARYFEQGQLSVPGQPILMLQQAGPLRVQLSIPDYLAAALAIGNELQVQFDTANGPELRSASLIILGSSADPASRTVPAELELSGNEAMFSGQFVRVRIPDGQRTSLNLPLSAVLRDGEIDYVWRVSSAGLLARTPVVLGNVDGESVSVVRGLSAGDRIIVEPQPGMYSGARVETASHPEAH